MVQVVMTRVSTRQIAVAGLLGALTVVLGLVPALGFIPVPTPAGHATTMHIPTILAGVVEGPAVGAAVGVIFGAFSFYRAQTEANPIARLMFTDPLIAFVPRIFIGLVAWGVMWLCLRWGGKAGAERGRWRGLLGRVGFAAGFGLVVAHTAFQALVKYGRMSPDVAAGVAAGAVGALVALAAWKILSHHTGAVGLAALCGSMTNTVGVLGLATWRGYLPAPAAMAVGVLHGIPEMLVAAVLTALVYRGLSGHRSLSPSLRPSQPSFRA